MSITISKHFFIEFRLDKTQLDWRFRLREEEKIENQNPLYKLKTLIGSRLNIVRQRAL